MFNVYADGGLMYYPLNESRVILSPKLILEVGKAGSFEFTIPPINPYYNSLRKLKSVITVELDGIEIFRGRVLSETRSFNNLKKIYCEGNLSYLVDSVQKGEAFDGTTHALFRKIIAAHNARVEESKRFTVGTIGIEDRSIVLTGTSDDILDETTPRELPSVNPDGGTGVDIVDESGDDDPGVDIVVESDASESESETPSEPTPEPTPTINYDYEQIAVNSVVNEWKTSYDYINTCLIENCGGYLRTRYEGGVTYIDYVTEYYNETALQEVTFGSNMLDLTEEASAEELFTVLIPLGDDNLTIESVNGGSDELIDTSAVAAYGRIVKTHVFDNVTEPSTLLENGQRYLAMHANIPISITVRAIDLHLVDLSNQEIHIGDDVKVRSLPHNVDQFFTCTKIEYDLDNAANNSYTFGNNPQSFTERYLKDKAKEKDDSSDVATAVKISQDWTTNSLGMEGPYTNGKYSVNNVNSMNTDTLTAKHVVASETMKLAGKDVAAQQTFVDFEGVRILGSNNGVAGYYNVAAQYWVENKIDELGGILELDITGPINGLYNIDNVGTLTSYNVKSDYISIKDSDGVYQTAATRKWVDDKYSHVSGLDVTGPVNGRYSINNVGTLDATNVRSDYVSIKDENGVYQIAATRPWVENLVGDSNVLDITGPVNGLYNINNVGTLTAYNIKSDYVSIKDDQGMYQIAATRPWVESQIGNLSGLDVGALVNGRCNINNVGTLDATNIRSTYVSIKDSDGVYQIAATQKWVEDQLDGAIGLDITGPVNGRYSINNVGTLDATNIRSTYVSIKDDQGMYQIAATRPWVESQIGNLSGLDVGALVNGRCNINNVGTLDATNIRSDYMSLKENDVYERVATRTWVNTEYTDSLIHDTLGFSDGYDGRYTLNAFQINAYSSIFTQEAGRLEQVASRKYVDDQIAAIDSFDSLTVDNTLNTYQIKTYGVFVKEAGVDERVATQAWVNSQSFVTENTHPTFSEVTVTGALTMSNGDFVATRPWVLERDYTPRSDLGAAMIDNGRCRLSNIEGINCNWIEVSGTLRVNSENVVTEHTSPEFNNVKVYGSSNGSTGYYSVATQAWVNETYGNLTRINNLDVTGPYTRSDGVTSYSINNISAITSYNLKSDYISIKEDGAYHTAATRDWVRSRGYLTSDSMLSYVTENTSPTFYEINATNQIYVNGNKVITEFMDTRVNSLYADYIYTVDPDKVTVHFVATQDWVNNRGYTTQAWVDEQLNSSTKYIKAYQFYVTSDIYIKGKSVATQDWIWNKLGMGELDAGIRLSNIEGIQACWMTVQDGNNVSRNVVYDTYSPTFNRVYANTLTQYENRVYRTVATRQWIVDKLATKGIYIDIN